MDWVTHFEANGRQRPAIPWQPPDTIDPAVRLPLIRSLQRFAVGERGDGRHLRAHAAATGDPAYARAIDLFVQEEQEHARLLARLLDRLGAPPLTWHWSDACFVIIRRLAGLHLELAVLLVAEVIALRYYRTLRDGTGDAVLRAVCDQILRDEAGHVAFHCATLRRAGARLPGPMLILAELAWRGFFQAVCLVVTLDHHPALQAMQVSPQQFWHDCVHLSDGATRQIFAPARPMEEQPGDGPWRGGAMHDA